MDPEQSGPSRGGKQYEKQGEKEQEKQQEKGQGLDEKYRRDPLGFVTFALLIIWLGVTLLLRELEVGVMTEEDQAWAIFAWGAGGLFFAEALLRMAVPRWRRSVGGSFVWGTIAIGVGFGLWFDKWEVIGPIVLIAVGLAILTGRLVRRR